MFITRTEDVKEGCCCCAPSYIDTVTAHRRKTIAGLPRRATAQVERRMEARSCHPSSCTAGRRTGRVYRWAPPLLPNGGGKGTALLPCTPSEGKPPSFIQPENGRNRECRPCCYSLVPPEGKPNAKLCRDPSLVARRRRETRWTGEGGGKTLRPSICCRENAGELLPHRHRTSVAVHRCFVGEGEEGERMLLVYPASPAVGPAVADHHRLRRSRGDPRPPLLSTIVPCGKGRAATLHRCCCRWPNGEGRTAEPCRCLAPCTAGEGEELLPLSLEKKMTPRAGEGGHTVVEAEGGINLRHRRVSAGNREAAVDGRRDAGLSESTLRLPSFHVALAESGERSRGGSGEDGSSLSPLTSLIANRRGRAALCSPEVFAATVVSNESDRAERGEPPRFTVAAAAGRTERGVPPSCAAASHHAPPGKVRSYCLYRWRRKRRREQGKEGTPSSKQKEGSISVTVECPPETERGRTTIAELLTPSQVVNPMKLAGCDDGSLVLCRRLATSKLCHGCHVMPPGRRDDAVAAPCSIKLPSTGEGRQGCRSPHCGYHPSMSLWPRVTREAEAEAERMEVRCRL
nr:hypothetical protein Iba_chr09aCG13640 [Ipomoea batatas]